MLTQPSWRRDTAIATLDALPGDTPHEWLMAACDWMMLRLDRAPMEDQKTLCSAHGAVLQGRSPLDRDAQLSGTVWQQGAAA